MNKTTKIIIAGAAAAIGMLIAGYIWVNNDRQAAVDTFNAFSGAMMEMDLPKAQSMASGEAHAALGMLAEILDSDDPILTIEWSKNPPNYEFVHADGELRVTDHNMRSVDNRGGIPTILRKTDGKWYVEEVAVWIHDKDITISAYFPIDPESLERTLEAWEQGLK